MSDLSRLLGDVYDHSPPPDEPGQPGDETAPTQAVAAAPPADPAPPAPAPARPSSPEWADESLLDEAFAEWVPGPAADASAAERKLVADLPGPLPPLPLPPPAPVELPRDTAPAAPAPAPVDEWPDGDDLLEPTPGPDPTDHVDLDLDPLDDPLLEQLDEGWDAPVPELVEVAPRPWVRSDDDILPVGRSKRRRRR